MKLVLQYFESRYLEGVVMTFEHESLEGARQDFEEACGNSDHGEFSFLGKKFDQYDCNFVITTLDEFFESHRFPK